MTLWYLSFATDEEFLGATVVKAVTAEGAVDETITRGLNPGGEIAMIEVPRGSENDPNILRLLDRLVGKDELMANGGQRLGDMTPEEREQFDASWAHEQCNPVQRK